mmetsp:Transcript_21409/g.39954  ORF Transcript_21409/g.39954 Transcript_21409/m.39954 type:complete len:206 (+) Transcript_21409:286-903(+)
MQHGVRTVVHGGHGSTRYRIAFIVASVVGRLSAVHFTGDSEIYIVAKVRTDVGGDIVSQAVVQDDDVTCLGSDVFMATVKGSARKTLHALTVQVMKAAAAEVLLQLEVGARVYHKVAHVFIRSILQHHTHQCCEIADIPEQRLPPVDLVVAQTVNVPVALPVLGHLEVCPAGVVPGKSNGDLASSHTCALAQELIHDPLNSCFVI